MTQRLSDEIDVASKHQMDDITSAGHELPAMASLGRRASSKDAEVSANANPTLEEAIYYADRQYAQNDYAPIRAMHQQVDDQSLPPGTEIRNGPLHWLWGAKSPEFHKQNGNVDTTPMINFATLDPERNADRDILDRLLLRRVSVLRAFFLITTDILGPFQSPYVYSQLGFVPATLTVLVMGALAFLGGICINVLWLRTDSDRMPVRNFGYLAKRIWGNRGKQMIDILYIVQMLISCGILMLSLGQSLGMIIDGAQCNPDGSPTHHVCFSVLVACISCVQLLLSPMRSLHNVGYLTFCAIGTALMATVLTTIFAYHTPPNYEQAMRAFGKSKGPVIAAAFVENTLNGKVSGLMNMVYAFGGSLIFPDIMSEMIRPWRFWKSSVLAQFLIVLVYCSIGVLVYARQGQFTQAILYFGLSKYAYQTIGNAMGTALGIIEALLYGNIVQKEIYYLVVRSWFKGPALMSRQGIPFWLVINVLVWTLAFVIGTAIPQIQSISGLIAAITTMQFSFTFPFLLKLSFDVQVDAMRDDKPFNVSLCDRQKTDLKGSGEHIVGKEVDGKGETDGQEVIAAAKCIKAEHRVDTWRDWSRWRRGLFTGNVKEKAMFFVLSLASLAIAILGFCSSIKSIIETFRVAKATSFGCETP